MMLMKNFSPLKVVYDFDNTYGNLYRHDLFGEQFDSEYQKPKIHSLLELRISLLKSVLWKANLICRLKFMHKNPH